MQTPTVLRLPLAILTVALAGCATQQKPQPSVYIEAPPAPAVVNTPPPASPTATTHAKELSRITNDPMPVFYPRLSPDGKQLLCFVVNTAQRGSDSLSVAGIDLASGTRKSLAGPGTWVAAWYPDGRQIVYSSLATSPVTLFRMQADGSAAAAISQETPGSFDDQPAVSPDGKKIAFHTSFQKYTQICTMKADGTGFAAHGRGTSPRWHPNGKLLAFDRPASVRSQIFILNLETGEEKQLTSGDADNAFPVWSPDGKWLVFVSDRHGPAHLYLMKPDGTGVTQLTTGGSQDHMPDWGTDGWIYFASDAGASVPCGSDVFYWPYANLWRLKPVLPE